MTIDEIIKYYEQELKEYKELETGRWIDVGSMSCRCNKCGCKNNKKTRFCPNCGTRMEGNND